ncbi:aminotransferase class I/II-fold pyridoxal phosphate-dependent enzyme [Pseudogracilibacillus auburnensis]|uniref:aminotransferase class I/II-fold pyridoxal phosphate-dependent enzyme n=1 Tax=Pseudogracilibacillus auburnensis TaxID=1494959 RepID=UPI001A958CEA|nr:aminotransferase class I/II-fold pyridoxal phosphate-dependent enzyme [Pseudogracilibacillus auburnensis]MBO1004746.1 aminotransferase class I/II-fold pyridoxal phosphate-dependent enzyme [Pseudogracilibacillus auburnensis]
MNQKRMPLYERLLFHQKVNPISFHVPGHKNGLLYGDEVFSRFLQLDLTELTGLDDLHDPQEEIAEAERLLTEYYGTKKSYFLVNGSTVGNLAMIMAVCNAGDTVLVQRNCHKSILNGLMLANVNPVFISPIMDEKLLTPSGIDAEMMKKALKQYPMTKACIFTYPDYYGQTYELEKMIEAAHEADIPVLIDEAHGPHFVYGEPFPPSALSLGADLVVHSAHKMLPAMTMGSYLHINGERVSEKKVKFYLSVLQSSSPSYPIMASLDFARSYLANINDEDIGYLLQTRVEFINRINEISELFVMESPDPLKLMIRHPALSGYELQSIFEEMAIFPEMADPYQVLFTFPLLKEGMEYPFNDAIKRMEVYPWSSIRSDRQIIEANEYPNNKISQLSFSYKEMQELDEKWVKMNEAVGQIASKMTIPYPPGIPLLLPGEEITKKHMKQLQSLIEAGARFQGDVEQLKIGKIAVFHQSLCGK